MTYDEALAKLEILGEYFYENNVKRKRVIVPLTKEYFVPFNEILVSKNVSKVEVKKFAIDNLYGIWAYDLNLLKGENFKI